MASIEERIFDNVVDCLERMLSPSIVDADMTDSIDDDDIEWTRRAIAVGYMLPWVIVETHDQNLEPIGLREGMKLQFDTPALFIEYGNLGDQYGSTSKDIPTFMEYPSLGIMREMTQIFLRVVLFDPKKQTTGTPRITHQIARARQDIRSCLGDSLRRDVPEVYQTWVGEYVRSHEAFYADTSEFIIPVEVWWRYDYRNIDRDPTAMNQEPNLTDVDITYDDTNVRISFTVPDNTTVKLIERDETYQLGREPNIFLEGYTDRDAVIDALDAYGTQDAIDNANFPDIQWLRSYNRNSNFYVASAYGGVDPVSEFFHRVNGNWETLTDARIDHDAVTSPVSVTWDQNYNKTYQLEAEDSESVSITPELRYPYYPTMYPESVYDDGNTPEQNLERKIRQEIQKEIDKGSSRKYFQGVNNVHSGPLSPKYLEVDNLPMICIMFDKSAIDVGQPVSGRGVGYRTATTNDESLSFTAMVYATADREYTDPYHNVRLVDNVLSDLREFVINYEQFDNVSGTFASIVGPISFPRIAQDVAGDLLFIGVFEFFIRYRPGG